MRKLASVLKELPKLALLEVVYLYDHYPARFLTLGASVIVYIARTRGIAVDTASAQHALLEVLAILAAGEGIHRKVTPLR